jgi:Flp pilus assembly protein TadD
MPEFAKASRMSALGYMGAMALLIAAILGLAWVRMGRSRGGEDPQSEFARVMASGRTFYEKGDPTRAIEAFSSALAMNPANPDVHLNLANAFLRANQPDQALIHARETLRFEPGNAAAFYLTGCALLRQNQYSNAVQALEEAKSVDRTVNPVSFQLGRALSGWGKYEEAAEQYREITRFETNTASPHLVASHYLLAQALLRLGQREEAGRELAEHQKLSAGKPQTADNPSVYETCVYTEIRAPFPLEQPARSGISVRFSNQTRAVFAVDPTKLHGPFGLMDINWRGWNDLLAVTPEGLQLFWNSNGVFTARGPVLRGPSITTASKILVGDLQNDRYDDAIVVSPDGVSVLRFATNGTYFDATRMARMTGVSGKSGVLADFDFTGKLGMHLVAPDGQLLGFTNVGTGLFLPRKSTEASTNASTATAGISELLVNDWNNDDLPDLFLLREGKPAAVMLNSRGAGLGTPETPPDWPVSSIAAVADFNNDLRSDIVFVTGKSIDIFFGGLAQPYRLAALRNQIRHLQAWDYDNDGWLDLVAWGEDGIRIWRNRGNLGFHEVTSDLGFDALAHAPIKFLTMADFDQDGDLDLIAEVAGQGVQFYRNEGGNANQSLKLRLLGNRSNSSGLGVKIEASAAGWHTLRFVDCLPVHLGVGKRDKLDSISTRWFETRLDNTEITLGGPGPMLVSELTMPTGSCPFIYVWNGRSNRFVTDILGSAPAGLPVAPGRYIEADTDEYVWIGNQDSVIPKEGHYSVRITEELREILYLDYARLAVADHPPGVEVHSTSRLVPGKPFPSHALVGVSGRIPFREARTLEGVDVTASLADNDGVKVSPPHIRGTHYRGLAEPHGVILDFGSLDAVSTPVLALTGWLRFGGGMANIAASHEPDFPFPFPVLEAETDLGWKKVDVQMGSPSGKTKTILVDLSGKLPPHTQRLRLTAAFEIHWDRIALFTTLGDRLRNPTEAGTSARIAIPSSATVKYALIPPTRTDLHWRGYSDFADLPSSEPLTPIYSQVRPHPFFQITPSGWATRYGAVDDLLAEKDNGLAVVVGGDELELQFDVTALPPVPPGMVRDFFLFTVGWDKDADYHVAAGDRIEPLPWHGMDDQKYGRQPRPAFPSDALQQKFATRWVGPRTYSRSN